MVDTDGGLPSETRVDRVVLTVDDRERSASFYRDVIGLEVLSRDDGATTLGVDGEPLLELATAPYAQPRGPDEAGLFHTAFRVPTRAALGDALERIRTAWELGGASDHLVSEALYCTDPEGNGVEVYRDRPRDDWPTTPDGRVEMDTLPLDVGEVSAAAAGRNRAPQGTDVGHVHLEVTSIPAARAFYVDGLGFRVRATYGSDALFVAAGDYHHHVGLNAWNGRTTPAAGRGLERVEFSVPDRAALSALRDRLESIDAETTNAGRGLDVTDPDGISLRFGVTE